MTPEMIDLLVREYLALQTIHQAYTDQVFLLKLWSVTAVGTALLASYARPIADMIGRGGAVFAALLAIPFWLLDALWTSHQSAHLDRLLTLEANFAASDDVAGMQAMTSWLAGSGALDGGVALTWIAPITGLQGLAEAPFLQALLSATTALPHLLMFVLCLLMALLVNPGKDRTETPRARRR